VGWPKHLLKHHLYIYPREDIYVQGAVVWYKGKRYTSNVITADHNQFIVSCELFLGGTEQWRIIGLDEIRLKFYTTEDYRNHIIEDILK